jgi:hypothetical protein
MTAHGFNARFLAFLDDPPELNHSAFSNQTAQTGIA